MAIPLHTHLIINEKFVGGDRLLFVYALSVRRFIRKIQSLYDVAGE